MVIWGLVSAVRPAVTSAQGDALDPLDIVAEVVKFFPTCTAFATSFITAGPTREAIDPVRYISNHSSGKMGFALAEAAPLQAPKVTLRGRVLLIRQHRKVVRIDAKCSRDADCSWPTAAAHSLLSVVLQQPITGWNQWLRRK